MTSFEYNPGLLRLEFETPELAGLVILHRRPTVESLRQVVALPTFMPVTAVTAEGLRTLGPLSESFAALVVGWNIADANGEPQMCSAEAFLALDALFVLRVTMSWARRAAGLPEVPAAPVVEEDAEEVDRVLALPVETREAS